MGGVLSSGILWRALLILWSLMAIPVTAATMIATVIAWPLALVALPLAVGDATSLVVAVLPRRLSLFIAVRAIAAISVVAAFLGFVLAGLFVFAFGYALLIFPAMGSGGTDGPGDVMRGLFAPLLPYGIASAIFFTVPLICLGMLGVGRKAGAEAL